MTDNSSSIVAVALAVRHSVSTIVCLRINGQVCYNSNIPIGDFERISVEITYRSGENAGWLLHSGGACRVRDPRSEEMRGVGNLTRATYANQRMTLILKIAKVSLRSGIRWSRYVVIHVACFIIHVSQGRLAMPQNRRGCMRHATLLFPRRGW